VAKYHVGVALVAACGFHTATATTSDAPIETLDALIDASPDAPGSGSGSGSASCLARWRDHSVRFNAPTELAPLMIGTGEDDPFITPDGLTIYFDSMGASSIDIFSSTRATVTDPFPAPQVDASLSSPQDESKASITGDGLDAFVASTATGGDGGLDVWETTRTTASSFGPWSETNLTMVNTSGSEYDPAISFDGQDLYLAPTTSGTQHVVVAARQPDRTFGAPVELTELVDPNGAADADPAPSHDELVLVFSSLRAGSGIPGGRNMWYATRATTGSAFSAPLLLPDLNTDDSDGGPDLSDDGCTLYFSSDRDGQIHIWVATVM
jgi:hypothetical protein